MSSKGLRAAVGKMLPPLVRILLRNGMAAKSFHELVRQAYVSVALDEFGIGGRAATTSRIAILTRLTRKEVQALLGRPLDGEDRYGRNTIARPESLPGGCEIPILETATATLIRFAWRESGVPSVRSLGGRI